MEGLFPISIKDGAESIPISDAGTYESEVLTDLTGFTRAIFQHDFNYGSGGTSVEVFVQTSLDQGDSWVDIARHGFTNAAKQVVWGIELGAAATFVPTDGQLGGGSDTVIAGIMGDRLRLKVKVLGTYAGGTSLASRVLLA